MKKKINIDVTKCMGCRKGISLFFKDEEGYNHVDLFASAEAGAQYKCENSDSIGEYLIGNDASSKYLPKEGDVKEFFDFQEMWWEDIIDLVYDVFKDQGKVTAFFNEGEKDNRTHNLPNEEIEAKLLVLAKENNIQITKDQYPDLLKFKNKK